MPDKTEALSSNASTSKDQIFLSTTPAPQRYDEKSRIIATPQNIDNILKGESKELEVSDYNKLNIQAVDNIYTDPIPLDQLSSLAKE